MSGPHFRTTAATVLVAALVLTGLWQTGSGAWIYVRAQLAQVLLQRAWVGTLIHNQNIKPWPWADTWPIARLIVPSLGIDQIVLEGAYGRTLAFAPAHVESTERLEEAGSIILTGHRDTHFRFLQQLQTGETIVLETRSGRRIRFTVKNRQIVDARTASIPSQDEDTLLMLVTCYPFDAIIPGGPLRYVVTAEA